MYMDDYPVYISVADATDALERSTVTIRHKHLKLDQTKIDRAKKLLNAKTEQETIERALDLLLGEDAILRAHRKVRGTGGFVDVFGEQ
jgi:hypothetical protein